MSETYQNDLLDLSSWRRFKYFIGADPKRVISMELRRMNPFAAAPFKRALSKARAAYVAVLPEAELERLKQASKAGISELEGLRASAHDDAEKLESSIRFAARLIADAQELQRRDEEATDAYFEAFDEAVLRRTIERSVRKLEMTVDGAAVLDGRAMFEVADRALLIFVINGLERMSTLSEHEGKASSSLSTSSVATTAGSGDSPATSTESEGGLTPSTATPAETVS